MNHEAEALAVVVRTAVGLGLLALTVKHLLLPTIVEEFRQRVFRVRRSLFLQVASGVIAPNDPAYRRLYRSMSGLLRFAERVTFTRLLISAVVFAKSGEAYAEHIKRLIAAAPTEEARNELELHREWMGYEILRHSFIVSPWVWPFVAGVSARQACSIAFDGVRSMAKQTLKQSVKKIWSDRERHKVNAIEAEAEADQVAHEFAAAA